MQSRLVSVVLVLAVLGIASAVNYGNTAPQVKKDSTVNIRKSLREADEESTVALLQRNLASERKGARPQNPQRTSDTDIFRSTTNKRDNYPEIIAESNTLPEVESVLPRLGSAATFLTFSDYELEGITGGLAYLPSTNWTEDFPKNVASWVEQYGTKEISTYYVGTQSYVNPGAAYTSPMIHARAFHTFHELDYETGYPFLFAWGGGSDVAELYEPADGWYELEFENGNAQAVYGGSSLAIGNLIIVVGGVYADGSPSQHVVVFDMDAFTVGYIRTTLPGRYGATLTFDDYTKKFVFIGGADSSTGKPTGDVYTWNILLGSNTWTKGEDTLAFASAFHAAFYDNNFGTIAISLGVREDFRDSWVYSFDLDTFTGIIIATPNKPVHPTKAGFAWVSRSVKPVYGLVFGGVREVRHPTEIYALEAYPSIFVYYAPSYNCEWRGMSCNPSFKYDNFYGACVMDSNEEECQECYDCADLSDVQLAYVSELKNKTLTHDHSGILRQCPAVWRQ